MTLEKHIQQGTLYVVDLTEISLNEPTVSVYILHNDGNTQTII